MTDTQQPSLAHSSHCHHDEWMLLILAQKVLLTRPWGVVWGVRRILGSLQVGQCEAPATLWPKESRG